METKKTIYAQILAYHQEGDSIDLESLAKRLPTNLVQSGPILSLKRTAQTALDELVAEGKIVKQEGKYQLPRELSIHMHPDSAYLSRHG